MFLATGAGAGAVAATGIVGAGTAASASTRRNPNSAQRSVVAFVKDPRSDVVTLMVGEDEVVVHDRDLVNRILNAAGGR